MGFCGNVTLDTSDQAEQIYQNVEGNGITPHVLFVRFYADSSNTGVTMLGPCRETSIANNLGGYELAPGESVAYEATGGQLVDLEEIWAVTQNVDNVIRWEVYHGVKTEADSKVV